MFNYGTYVKAVERFYVFKGKVFENNRLRIQKCCRKFGVSNIRCMSKRRNFSIIEKRIEKKIEQ